MVINLTVAYLKTLYYDRIDVSEGIHCNKMKNKRCTLQVCYMECEYK